MFKGSWSWVTVGEVAAGIIVAGLVIGLVARR
jgi:hypothetical protein